MSQQEHYETVMREQEQLEARLQDYKFHKDKLEWELMSVTNDIEKIETLIAQLEKELGNVSHSWNNGKRPSSYQLTRPF